MDVDLSEEFRGILSLVLLASGFVMSVVLAVSRNGGEDFEEESLFVLVLVVWIICFITPSSFFSCLRWARRTVPLVAARPARALARLCSLT